MKPHPRTAALLALVTIGEHVMAAEDGRIKLLDTIQGGHYQAIDKAVKVLDHRKLDLSKHNIRLVREGKSEYVILSESEGEPAARKNFGVKAGTSTELDLKESARLASESPKITELAKVQGAGLRAIRAANVVFSARSPNPDLAQYKIEVVKDGDRLVVIYADKDQKEGARGSTPGRSGMEVTLDRDLHVVRSHFIR
jgi:hypothetical protein